MQREGFEVSLLFAERLGFYHQFGWREVPRKFSVLMSAAAMGVPDGFRNRRFRRRPRSARRGARFIARTRAGSASPWHGMPRTGRETWCLQGTNRNIPEMDPPSISFARDARQDRRLRAGQPLSRRHDGDGIRLRRRRGGCDPGSVSASRRAASGGAHRCAETIGELPCCRRAGSTGSGVLVTHTAHDQLLEDSLAAAGAVAAITKTTTTCGGLSRRAARSSSSASPPSRPMAALLTCLRTIVRCIGPRTAF